MALHKKILHYTLAFAILAFMPVQAQAEDTATERAAAPKPSRELTITVLPFDVKNVDQSMIKRMQEAITEGALPEADTLGKEFAILLMEELTSTYALSLVDREDLDKALGEMELGISGTIEPDAAAKIGHLVGAQVIVTGRIFPVKKNMVFVAKIMSVETGRVYGQTINLPLNGYITEAATEMAMKVASTISDKQDVLMADLSKDVPITERLAPLMAKYEGKTLPVVSVSIEEEHINAEAIDPAAETEIGMILQQLGFKIIDPLSSNEVADVKITGAAFSEFGMRKGNLVSSKGRIEIKALKRDDGSLLLIDREVATGVDLSPNIAGRMALAKAGSLLVERIVPVLLEQATAAE